MSATRIHDVIAWEALDSRGKPTVAVRVVLDDGAAATALVPSGASAGSHEALELRDGGTRYAGDGVRTAIAHVRETIRPAVLGTAAEDPEGVDRALAALDPTPGYGTIGANALLAVSLATWRVAAAGAGVSLARLLSPAGPLPVPMPMVNIVSGGAHAGGLIDIQDVLVIPHGAASFGEAVEWAVAVRASARRLALEAGFGGAVLAADEGGLGLPLTSNRAALDLVTRAIEHAGYRAGEQVSIALDVAATEFFDGTAYDLASEGRRLSATELIDELAAWTRDFPVISIEDAVAEDDWTAWGELTERLGGSIELVGDDLFVTNPDRLRQGIERSSANSVLVKVNQNGLVSGAASVVRIAQEAGYRTVVSARSGETEDSWLSDLAVGWHGGQIKVGSTQRSERTAKWNRLLELEATDDTVFAGPWPLESGRARPAS